MRGETKIKIMDLAESYIRQKGFNSFSFRDIAADLGIKSASVHYHFPTKGMLGAAVARRYTETFMAALADIDERTRDPRDKLLLYSQIYRQAVESPDSMCLCGVMAVEARSIPEEASTETRLFFTKNIDWLRTVFEDLFGDSADAREIDDKAHAFIAVLEGGMLLSRSFEDVRAFDRSVQPFLQSLK